MLEFDAAFKALTGNPPFPWQQALYERFKANEIPASCNLPTGLGKTSVIAIWLIALANKCNVPRRLVYVVNRRTVVDQTTDEVEKYKKVKVDGIPDFAISTLRGQFADNREWSADPSRPAVICGTVDMIGSRLLFSGYGIGFKSKPLHAGFLGQDALIVHDEAHLEPAFQKLLIAIQIEQERCKEFAKFHVMELTATSRGEGEVFELTDEEKEQTEEIPNPPTKPIQVVWKRLQAEKKIDLLPIADEKKELAPMIVKRALELSSESDPPAVLVFVRTVDGVNEVVAGLKKGKVAQENIQTLTGTMRGFERDAMARSNKVFARYKPGTAAEKQPGTVYLVCTSAGEVGVDISADHLVCDLSTFESMAQRFGRVNRYGEKPAKIVIVHPQEAAFDDKEYDARRKLTLALLQELQGDGSPKALGKLNAKKRLEAFAPTPVILPVTDILFDAWALTTITGKLPGRPPVEPHLHGLPTEWQPSEAQVAWREEVSALNVKPWTEWEKKEFDKFVCELLDDYPLKPHELLKDTARRVFDRLKKLKAPAETPVWLQSQDDSIAVTTLGSLADGVSDDLNYITVILPPEAGGLNEQGMLDDKIATPAKDVADEWFLKDREGKLRQQRLRLWNDIEDDEKTDDLHLIRTITFPGPESDEDAEGKTWSWFRFANEGDQSARKPVEWSVHVQNVVDRTKEIVANLPLDQPLKEALIFAAECHDHGKKRKLFQTVLGNNRYPDAILAKSGKKGGRVAELYRHEFGSLLDVLNVNGFDALAEDMREMVLHLIAAHHGRGRPHFPAEEAFDPLPPGGANPEAMAASVPRRFAKLQRQYGRWGLAYLESLLRAADWAASANPSKFMEDSQ